MSNIRKNLTVVFNRILEASRDEDVAIVYAEELDKMLDNLAYDDFFGTERQLDPRGDFRDGEENWEVAGRIEGLD